MQNTVNIKPDPWRVFAIIDFFNIATGKSDGNLSELVHIGFMIIT